MPDPIPTGSLTVVTTTGRGTMPVAGARVAVATERGGAPQTAVTDRDGRTPPFLLAAPAALDSQTPDAPQPYAVYTVAVEADGFRPVDALGVAVFAGVSATLPVDLTPSMGPDQPREVERFPPQELG